MSYWYTPKMNEQKKLDTKQVYKVYLHFNEVQEEFKERKTHNSDYFRDVEAFVMTRNGQK